jgi:hypothetical protein
MGKSTISGINHRTSAESLVDKTLQDADSNGVTQRKPHVKVPWDFAHLIKPLHAWFKGLFEGRVTIDVFYEKGLKLKETIEGAGIPSAGESRYQDVQEALDFIDSLHDQEAREYNQRNREQVYYYMRQLSTLL